MFLKEIDDKSKAWKFFLIDGQTLVGQVNGYLMGVTGHMLMIQIIDGAVIGYTTDIPWHSVVKIQPLGQKAVRRVQG